MGGNLLTIKFILVNFVNVCDQISTIKIGSKEILHPLASLAVEKSLNPRVLKQTTVRHHQMKMMGRLRLNHLN